MVFSGLLQHPEVRRSARGGACAGHVSEEPAEGGKGHQETEPQDNDAGPYGGPGGPRAGEARGVGGGEAGEGGGQDPQWERSTCSQGWSLGPL